jgi:hypothetical protein
MPGNPDGAVTFILLSYARPQNIQRIIDAIMKAESCDRIILSNNNPHIDILKYIDPAPEVLEVIQQREKWEPVKRFVIARECESEFFVCIDDDLFLTSRQIDLLVEQLRADPSVAHGICGERVQLVGKRYKLNLGITNFSGEVDVINRAYAFTRHHVQQFFELMEYLGVQDPRQLGRGDDILLSFSGAGRPRCHDLGPLESCPTSDQEGIALWREKGFFEQRVKKFGKLSRLRKETIRS